MRFNIPSVVARAALVAAVVALPARAQGSSPVPKDLVVTPAWLAARLHDPNLVVLHVGPENEFAATHIPGARFVDLDSIAEMDHHTVGALMLEMPAPEKLRRELEGFGISDNSNIVVYSAKEWFTPSTRVLFTLDYAGLGSHTHYLDGGLEGWTRAGHPVSSEKTPPRVGKLSPLALRPIVVNADYVKAHLAAPHVAIVDARAAVFYDGVQPARTDKGEMRRGHIAGARSIPFTEITDDQLMLKTPEQLRALFTKAGVAPGDTVVGYCHVGQQATGMLLGARLLGHPVLLYDGSYEDWSRHTDYPVEASSARGNP